MDKVSVNDSTRKVLSVIFQNQPISRSDIAIETGLSKAAVSYSIEELLKQGIVIEKGSATASRKGGPRPINLYINEDFAYIITMLPRLNEPIVRVDSLNGQLKKDYSFSKTHYDDFHNMLNEAITLAKQAIKDFDEKKILGVGVSIPGNVKDNKVINSPYYNVEDFDLTQKLREALNKDVYVERDVYNMAYGEKWKGCGRQHRDFFTIWAGTGIGSAIIIDSKLIKGIDGLAGEMGFMAVDKQAYRDTPYTLNDFGYFEKITSVKRMEEKYNKPFFELATLAQSEAEVKNDLFGVCDNLAMGLASAIVLLNPSAIVINGRFRYAKACVEEYLNSRLKLLCPINCPIEYSSLGVDAITLGGAYLVLNQKLGIEF